MEDSRRFLPCCAPPLIPRAHASLYDDSLTWFPQAYNHPQTQRPTNQPTNHLCSKYPPVCQPHAPIQLTQRSHSTNFPTHVLTSPRHTAKRRRRVAVRLALGRRPHRSERRCSTPPELLLLLLLLILILRARFPPPEGAVSPVDGAEGGASAISGD